MEDKRKNPLDDLFRNKLNEEQLEPDNQLWNEIEQELQQKEKPNRRILFILFAVLLLAGVTGLYFMNGNKNSVSGNITVENIKTTSASVESNATIQTKTAVPENSNTIPSNDNSSITADNNSVSSSSTENSNSSKSTSISKNNSYKSTSTNQNKTVNTNSTVTPTSEIEKKREVESIAVSPTDSESENSVSTSNDSKNNSTQETNEITTSNNNSETEKKDELNSANQENKIATTSTSSDTNSENEIVKKEYNQPEDISPIKKDSTVVAVTFPTNDPTTIKTQRTIKWYAEAGTSYLNHSSKIKSDSAYYLQRRSDEESKISNFNYAIHFGAIISHLQLQSGIGIYKPGEKINYKNVGTCLSLKSTGYYLPDSTFVYQYDSTYHIAKNDSLIKQNGTHTNTYLTIPLEVYYHFPMNKIDVQVGGGMSGAFPLKWNSTYINQQVIQLENPSDLKMLNPVVLNLNLNLGIAIPVYKNLSVVLDAEYGKNLNSVLKKSYSVNQKYQSVGAGISIRYTFN